ncbi:glycosyltransferase [bacterium]|nr:glycosyltransferase [bacterium]
MVCCTNLLNGKAGSIVNAPVFSIVIPLYNRAEQIGRTLESCLGREGDDFEIIVVDDASTDDSVSRVQAYRDERIRLVQHSVNRGVGSARNTGIDAARGEWIVLLDSDHELLPNALSCMRRDLESISESIAQISYNCVYENGDPCPDPPLRAGTWNYRDFLAFAERSQQHSDMQTCTRRETFRRIRFPESRMLESGYHMDFARRYRIETRPDVIKRIYRDSGDRISDSRGRALLKRAPDQAEGLRDLLRTHGKALRRYAPGKYRHLVGACALYAFLADKRATGFRMAVHILAGDPANVRLWAILLLGLAGHGPLLVGMQAMDGLKRVLRRVRRGI